MLNLKYRLLFWGLSYNIVHNYVLKKYEMLTYSTANETLTELELPWPLVCTPNKTKIVRVERPASDPKNVITYKI
jgi:hypothetical protein